MFRLPFDVDHALARSADEMVVVLFGSGFESSRQSGRLDPSQQSMVDQRSQAVIDRLVRYRADSVAHIGLDEFRAAMRRFGHGFKDGHPLGGHLKAFSAKDVLSL